MNIVCKDTEMGSNAALRGQGCPADLADGVAAAQE